MEGSELAKKLLEWWKKNKRVFPWRESCDPYHVLVGEILLHRTKANQVVPVYQKFVEKFPTIATLANASFAEVRKIVHSLGLLWRTEALHKMAQDILTKFEGRIPVEREKLESLPGISHYIASAVRCFAFGYPEVLLDTNTVRIVGRVFGAQISDGSRRNRTFQRLYDSILDKENSRDFNYAMLDLGALVCLPSEPLCNICPVIQICVFGSSRLGKRDAGNICYRARKRSVGSTRWHS